MMGLLFTAFSVVLHQECGQVAKILQLKELDADLPNIDTALFFVYSYSIQNMFQQKSVALRRPHE